MTGGEPCRVDVWLWRARFFKTRALAARFIDEGRVRITRAAGGADTRLDKPSRSLRPGDGLVFAVAGRLFAVRVLDIGERRGPACEAQRLYAPLTEPEAKNSAASIDNRP